MNVYHAIICCRRDEALLEQHLVTLHGKWHGDAAAIERCVYFGHSRDESLPQCGLAHHVIGALDLYENLPVKTYCLIEHALSTSEGWDVLLKTDATAEVVSIDWDAVARHELVGLVADWPASRMNHRPKVFQPALRESYAGPLPSRWVGGPAYAIHRSLAKQVVARGIWYARGHAYEDQMVSLVAEEAGIAAAPGIVYRDLVSAGNDVP